MRNLTRFVLRLALLAIVAAPFVALAQAATPPATTASVPAWMAIMGSVALLASWLLAAVQGFEAVIIKAGWWDGKRTGLWLFIYGLIQFAAQNLGNFFPSRAARMTTAAPASP